MTSFPMGDKWTVSRETLCHASNSHYLAGLHMWWNKMIDQSEPPQTAGKAEHTDGVKQNFKISPSPGRTAQAQPTPCCVGFLGARKNCFELGELSNTTSLTSSPNWFHSTTLICCVGKPNALSTHCRCGQSPGPLYPASHATIQHTFPHSQ